MFSVTFDNARIKTLKGALCCPIYIRQCIQKWINEDNF